MPRFLRSAAAAVFLAAAACLYAHGRDRDFVAAPYLASPGSGRVTVRGFTREPSRWSVLPVTPGSPHGEERAATTRHDVDLEGLPRGRTVEVQVLSDGTPVEGGRLRFRTEPGPDAPAFDFAVVGDSGAAPSRFLEFFGKTSFRGAHERPERVVARMSSVRPELVLHTGDVVYGDGERENYARCFFRPFGPLIATAPIAASVGDHDLTSEDGLPFVDALALRRAPALSEGKYGSFDYGPLHVAIVNSNEEDHDLPDQIRWLEDDLRKATRPWKVVVSHVPLWFSSETQRRQRTPRQLAISDSMRAVCERAGVAVVFAGHHHWYERSPPLGGGMVQIITGGGGGVLAAYDPGAYAFAASYFHFVHVRVEGDSMTIRPLRETGQEIEPEGAHRIGRR